MLAGPSHYVESAILRIELRGLGRDSGILAILYVLSEVLPPRWTVNYANLSSKPNHDHHFKAAVTCKLIWQVQDGSDL